jgi:hypothetical protein
VMRLTSPSPTTGPTRCVTRAAGCAGNRRSPGPT